MSKERGDKGIKECKGLRKQSGNEVCARSKSAQSHRYLRISYHGKAFDLERSDGQCPSHVISKIRTEWTIVYENESVEVEVVRWRYHEFY